MRREVLKQVSALLRSAPLFSALSFCALIFSGCAIWPYQESHVIAARPGSGTNVVERLIQSDIGLASWALLKPCYAGPEIDKGAFHYSYYVKQSSGSRTKVGGLTFLKHEHQDWKDQDNLWDHYWKVRPVMGTNLWVAFQQYPGRTPNELRLGLHLFSAEGVVAERELNGVPWVPDDFRFDGLSQKLTYRTQQGYETYDLLRDTVVPSGAPP